MVPTTTRALRLWLTVATALALLVPIGCSKPSLPGDLQVGEITTGRALSADGSIAADSQTNLFWTTDTFYVSVKTDGSAQEIAFQARWIGPDGKVIADATETISPSGATITSFEAQPKDGRWPEGDYKVEILINGVSQGSKDLNAR